MAESTPSLIFVVDKCIICDFHFSNIEITPSGQKVKHLNNLNKKLKLTQETIKQLHFIPGINEFVKREARPLGICIQCCRKVQRITKYEGDIKTNKKLLVDLFYQSCSNREVAGKRLLKILSPDQPGNMLSPNVVSEMQPFIQTSMGSKTQSQAQYHEGPPEQYHVMMMLSLEQEAAIRKLFMLNKWHICLRCLSDKNKACLIQEGNEDVVPLLNKSENLEKLENQVPKDAPFKIKTEVVNIPTESEETEPDYHYTINTNYEDTDEDSNENDSNADSAPENYKKVGKNFDRKEPANQSPIKTKDYGNDNPRLTEAQPITPMTEAQSITSMTEAQPITPMTEAQPITPMNELEKLLNHLETSPINNVQVPLGLENTFVQYVNVTHMFINTIKQQNDLMKHLKKQANTGPITFIINHSNNLTINQSNNLNSSSVIPNLNTQVKTEPVELLVEPSNNLNSYQTFPNLTNQHNVVPCVVPVPIIPKPVPIIPKPNNQVKTEPVELLVEPSNNLNSYQTFPNLTNQHNVVPCVVPVPIIPNPNNQGNAGQVLYMMNPNSLTSPSIFPNPNNQASMGQVSYIRNQTNHLPNLSTLQNLKNKINAGQLAFTVNPPDSLASSSTSQMPPTRPTTPPSPETETKPMCEHMIKTEGVANDQPSCKTCLQCPRCFKYYLTHIKLRKHYMRCCPQLLCYTCDICQNCYQTRDELWAHRRESGHRAKKSERFQCDICGKIIQLYSSWKEHQNMHVKEDKGIVYSCDVCGKLLRSAYRVNLHKKTQHEKVKRINCKICSKSFPHEFSLRGHVRTCHGNKTFSCETCGKTVRTKTNLRIHVRSHTGEKPYPCKLCNYTCTNSSNLQKHMKVHLRNGDIQPSLAEQMGELPYKCVQNCSSVFETLRQLRLHYSQCKLFMEQNNLNGVKSEEMEAVAEQNT